MGREYHCNEFDCEVCPVYDTGLCDLLSQHWASFINGRVKFFINDFGEILDDSKPITICNKKAYIMYPLAVLQ